jgi:hypothetical protein
MNVQEFTRRFAQRTRNGVDLLTEEQMADFLDPIYERFRRPARTARATGRLFWLVAKPVICDMYDVEAIQRFMKRRRREQLAASRRRARNAEADDHNDNESNDEDVHVGDDMDDNERDDADDSEDNEGDDMVDQDDDDLEDNGVDADANNGNGNGDDGINEGVAAININDDTNGDDEESNGGGEEDKVTNSDDAPGFKVPVGQFDDADDDVVGNGAEDAKDNEDGDGEENGGNDTDFNERVELDNICVDDDTNNGESDGADNNEHDDLEGNEGDDTDDNVDDDLEDNERDEMEENGVVDTDEYFDSNHAFVLQSSHLMEVLENHVYRDRWELARWNPAPEWGSDSPLAARRVLQADENYYDADFTDDTANEADADFLMQRWFEDVPTIIDEEEESEAQEESEPEEKSEAQEESEPEEKSKVEEELEEVESEVEEELELEGDVEREGEQENEDKE